MPLSRALSYREGRHGRETVRQIDSNKDGFIDEPESVAAGLDKQEFNRYKNQDGVIDVQQYCGASFAHEQLYHEVAAACTEGDIEKLKRSTLSTEQLIGGLDTVSAALVRLPLATH